MRTETFRDGQITLYLADCTQFRPPGGYDVVLTDPPWSNLARELAHIDYYQVFSGMCRKIPRKCKRAIIQLGFRSDPAMLHRLPKRLGFVRVVNCRYNFPNHAGRFLGGMEHAYVYGTLPRWRPEERIISGVHLMAREEMEHRVLNCQTKGIDHPCPRPLSWTEFLVKKYCDDDETVYDPFMGSGTTAVACWRNGMRFVGCEINETYFDAACRRVEKETKQGILPLS